MTIFVDSSELKTNSLTANHLPQGFTELSNLEELTGGDIMISIADLPKPVNDSLARLHIRNQALIIQVKHGHDITSSMGYRLRESIRKMRDMGCYPYQATLLFIGYIIPDKNGYALINNQLSYNKNRKSTWLQVQSAIGMGS